MGGGDKFINEHHSDRDQGTCGTAVGKWITLVVLNINGTPRIPLLYPGKSTAEHQILSGLTFSVETPLFFPLSVSGNSLLQPVPDILVTKIMPELRTYL